MKRIKEEKNAHEKQKLTVVSLGAAVGISLLVLIGRHRADKATTRGTFLIPRDFLRTGKGGMRRFLETIKSMFGSQDRDSYDSNGEKNNNPVALLSCWVTKDPEK